MKLAGVEGVVNGFKLLGSVRVDFRFGFFGFWSALGIGDIPGDPIIRGFTLGDIELLGVEGVGVGPAIEGLELITFGIGDIPLGDSSIIGIFLRGIKLLGVEGVGDWDSETVGDILLLWEL